MPFAFTGAPASVPETATLVTCTKRKISQLLAYPLQSIDPSGVATVDHDGGRRLSVAREVLNQVWRRADGSLEERGAAGLLADISKDASHVRAAQRSIEDAAESKPHTSCVCPTARLVHPCDKRCDDERVRTALVPVRGDPHGRVAHVRLTRAKNMQGARVFLDFDSSRTQGPDVRIELNVVGASRHVQATVRSTDACPCVLVTLSPVEPEVLCELFATTQSPATAPVVARACGDLSEAMAVRFATWWTEDMELRSFATAKASRPITFDSFHCAREWRSPRFIIVGRVHTPANLRIDESGAPLVACACTHCDATSKRSARCISKRVHFTLSMCATPLGQEDSLCPWCGANTVVRTVAPQLCCRDIRASLRQVHVELDGFETKKHEVSCTIRSADALRRAYALVHDAWVGV